MKRSSALLLLMLLLPGFLSSGCRLFLRLPDEITDARLRELHGLGEIPEDETWWQTRDRRLEEQEKLLFRFPLEERWSQPFDDSRALTGAPLPAGRSLYLTVPAEGLVRLNAEDGIPVWTFATLPGETCGPLAAAGDLLVFATDAGRVTAVSPDDGPRVAWEVMLDETGPGRPTADGGAIYLPTAGGTVSALEARDGGLRWRHRTGEPMVAAPLADRERNRVYCVSLNGTVLALDAESGVAAWRYDTGSPIRGQPLLAGERLYVGCDDGRFHCLEAENGETRWIKPTGAAIRTPAAADGKLVIFGSWDGFLYALDQRSGRTRWKAELPNRIDLPPVCIDGLVLLACVRSPELRALDIEDGRSAGSFKLEHLDAWFTTMPRLSEERQLFAGTSRGKLLALAEVIEEEMTEEEASRARFEELLGRRRQQGAGTGNTTAGGGAPGGQRRR